MILEREIIKTADGSTTIHLKEWNEQYHSKHGAIQEAYHVYINHGLLALEQPKISVLEMGFGTGLNALITYWEGQKRNLTIDYVGIDAFPVTQKELSQLNYTKTLQEQELQPVFHKLHQVDWDKPTAISNLFTLEKKRKKFFEVDSKNHFNLVYFDAFSPRVQPDLWTTKMFEKMFFALKENGFLVTYAAKGSVRRNLQEVGFTIERLPGPRGKREMLRAKKLCEL